MNSRTRHCEGLAHIELLLLVLTLAVAALSIFDLLGSEQGRAIAGGSPGAAASTIGIAPVLTAHTQAGIWSSIGRRSGKAAKPKLRTRIKAQYRKFVDELDWEKVAMYSAGGHFGGYGYWSYVPLPESSARASALTRAHELLKASPEDVLRALGPEKGIRASPFSSHAWLDENTTSITYLPHDKTHSVAEYRFAFEPGETLDKVLFHAANVGASVSETGNAIAVRLQVLIPRLSSENAARQRLRSLATHIDSPKKNASELLLLSVRGPEEARNIEQLARRANAEFLISRPDAAVVKIDTELADKTPADGALEVLRGLRGARVHAQANGVIEVSIPSHRGAHYHDLAAPFAQEVTNEGGRYTARFLPKTPFSI